MSNDESWEAYRHGIDQILNEDRPARIGIDEREWRERAYGWARNHMPDESNLLRNTARRDVDLRETRAIKQGNLLLRAYAKGQAPLSWSIVGPFPVKVGRLRIRLDAATPDDIEDAAREVERVGKLTYDEVVLLAGCMRDLARLARRSGLGIVAQLGDLKPPDDDDPDDDDPDDDDPDDDDGRDDVPF